MVSLFPFVKTQRKRAFKYPLKKDDPDLKEANLWLKYTWLIEDGESEESSLPPPPPSANTNADRSELKPTLSAEQRRNCVACLNTLAKCFNSLADFDILSSASLPPESKERREEFRDKFWTPDMLPGLDSTSTDASFLSYASNLNSNLIPDLAKLALKCAQTDLGDVAKSTDAGALFSVDVREEIQKCNVTPHCMGSFGYVVNTLLNFIPTCKAVCFL